MSNFGIHDPEKARKSAEATAERWRNYAGDLVRKIDAYKRLWIKCHETNDATEAERIELGYARGALFGGTEPRP